MRELPVSEGHDRIRLWDNQWCVMYDSAIATAPIYPYIANWINATIDRPDGTRWVGRFYRCREGIGREADPDPGFLKHFLEWPTFDALTGGER